MEAKEMLFVIFFPTMLQCIIQYCAHNDVQQTSTSSVHVTQNILYISELRTFNNMDDGCGKVSVASPTTGGSCSYGLKPAFHFCVFSICVMYRLLHMRKNRKTIKSQRRVCCDFSISISIFVHMEEMQTWIKGFKGSDKCATSILSFPN